MKTKTLWPLFLFLATAAICAVVFIDVLPVMSLMQAPDGMPPIAPTSLLNRMLPWMSGNQPSITHDDLLRVFPFLVYHELSFIVSTALLALAMGVYLRVIGLPILACCAGGLAMAFSGYHFTLFNAGHRGYFIMMPYAIFMFALVERCLRNPRWFHFALIPFCVVAGLSTQPDVFAMIVMILAVYAIFRLIYITSKIGFASYLAGMWKKLLFGIAIFLIMLALVGYNTIHHVITVTLAGRDKQLAELTAPTPNKPAESKTAAELDAEKQAQWIFATNWSLPPEAMVEFIAPCLRGLDTANPKGPYWGRLGRSIDWEQSQQGFGNFRQHSLYLGAVQCAIALYAVMVAVIFSFSKRKRSPSGEASRRDPLNSMTLFWLGVFVVSLLLALGRYAPFYKLFYAIPILDKVRAPVKFVHLAEIAVSVLFATGIARLLNATATQNEKKLRLAGRIAMIVTVLVAALCVGASLSFSMEAHAGTWSLLGIPAGALHQTLAALYKGAFMRAAWMLVIAAVALGMTSFADASKKAAIASASVLLLIFASVFDMAEVGRRYVVMQDLTSKFAANPVLESMRKQGPLDGRAYSYLQLTNQLIPGNVPFVETLSMASVLSMDPFANEGPDSAQVKAYMAFKDDLVKRWKYWGAEAVFAQPKVAAEMSRAGMVKLTGLYDFDPQMRLVTPPSLKSAQVAVVEPVGMIPAVALFHGWRVADADDALSQIAASDFDIDKQIVVTGTGIDAHDSDEKYTPATWVETPLETRGNKAVIKVTAEKSGMLFIRENTMRHTKLAATVNNKKTPIYKANGIFLCLPVEAGESTVVLRPYLSATAIVGTIAALAFAIFALVSFTKFEKSQEK